MRYRYAIALAVLVAVLAAAIVTGTTFSIDLAVRNAIHALASNDLTRLARLFSFIGSVGVWMTAALVAVAALGLTAHRKPALAIVASMSGAVVLDNFLKAVFHRARPAAFFGTVAGGYSFPSGHALFAACFYGALAAVLTAWFRSAPMRVAIWAVAVLMTLCIGWSRIYLGVHYPSDVLTGYLIGAAWLATLQASGLFGPDWRGEDGAAR